MDISVEQSDTKEVSNICQALHYLLMIKICGLKYPQDLGPQSHIPNLSENHHMRNYMSTGLKTH